MQISNPRYTSRQTSGWVWTMRSKYFYSQHQSAMVSTSYRTNRQKDLRNCRLFAIETWWLEKNAFKYGEKNNLTLVGHYTQLVWAASHELGCGLSECHQETFDKNGTVNPRQKRTFFNYVCNYCPM